MTIIPTSHRDLIRHPVLGVACKCIRCNAARPPQACVLLLVSMSMMLVTIVASLAFGGL